MPKTITGRCMFIWRLAPVLKTELGVKGLVDKAQAAGLRGVWIKVADGASAYENVRGAQRRDVFSQVREALRNAGIAVWGWQVPYGGTVSRAMDEADCAAGLAEELDLDGLLMDAEGGAGYFTGGEEVAEAYASRLAERLGANGRGLAMCGNDIPHNFPGYPFATFVARAESNAPQVYTAAAPASRIVSTAQSPRMSVSTDLSSR
jgi:hypothetical protein